MLIILILGGCALFIATTFVTNTLVIDKVQEIHDESNAHIIEGVKDILKSQAKTLVFHNRDWSSWNSTYLFASGKYPDFMEKELIVDSLKNLDIDLFLILNNDGNSFFVSNNEGEWVNASVRQISASSEFKPDNENWNRTGYTSIDDKIILLAANPILHNDSTGPIEGTLIWGRIMDDERFSALVPFSWGKVLLSKLDKADVQSSGHSIISVGDTHSPAAMPLEQDLTGFDPIQITMLEDMSLYEEIIADLNRAVYVFLLINGAVIVACIHLLNITLVKSFKNINEQVSKIDVKQTLSSIDYDKTNELSPLVNGINMLLKEIEEFKKQLADSERLAAIGQTASMVGHDLRNPLQTITLTSYLLRKNPVEEKQRQYLLDTIDAQTKYMDKIVGDIQMYSNSSVSTFVKCDILKLAADALAQLKIPEGIQASVESNPVLPEVDVSGDMIKRVFSSLILNAVQAMPGGGTIRVYAEEVDGAVVASVQDSGPGIAESGMLSLFKPFYTTKAKGAGLGLASSRKIVEAHGGVISVESKVGVGSRFFFSIPLRKEVHPSISGKLVSP